MSCLMCNYYQPIEPTEHKQERENGTCQQRCGREWDHHAAIQYVKRHRKYLDGWCLLHPEPKQKCCSHVCGDISLLNFLTNEYWQIQPFEHEDSDTLYEWAAKQMRTLLNGTDRERHMNHLEAENKKLREQLKNSRKISASRLERLRKLPEPQQSPQETTLPKLRVVA